MFQRLEIIGYVGREPEQRYTQTGQPVTSFSVATSRKWTGSDGQPKEETIWFKVTTWGKLAETCAKYVTKGMLIMCEGRLPAQINIWTDQTGSPRAGYEMTADGVKFLNSKQDNNNGNGNGHSVPAYQQPRPQTTRPPATAPATTAEPVYQDYEGGGMTEDEVPF